MEKENSFVCYLAVGMAIGILIVIIFIKVTHIPSPLRYTYIDSLEVRECVDSSNGSTREFRKCMHYEE